LPRNWVRHDPENWLASEARFMLSLLARGLLREIEDLALAHGSAPAEHPALARAAACSQEEISQAWPEVSKFVQPIAGQPGRITTERAVSLLAEADEYRSRQAANGKRGGRPRKTEPGSQQKAVGFSGLSEMEALTYARTERTTRTETEVTVTEFLRSFAFLLWAGSSLDHANCRMPHIVAETLQRELPGFLAEETGRIAEANLAGEPYSMAREFFPGLVARLMGERFAGRMVPMKRIEADPRVARLSEAVKALEPILDTPEAWPDFDTWFSQQTMAVAA
jgi:hypothetical protein